MKVVILSRINTLIVYKYSKSVINLHAPTYLRFVTFDPNVKQNFVSGQHFSFKPIFCYISIRRVFYVGDVIYYALGKSRKA